MNLWFYGLADCHGVESFIDDLENVTVEFFMDESQKKQRDSQQFAMCLRAQANQQRHAVVYRAQIPEESVNIIEAMIKESKYAEALTQIKETAIEVQVGTYGTTKRAAEKNWKMIPNPDLDPYHD